ncbi:flagellar biosynthesis protein FlhB [Cognatishimia sp. MH4019]|uniref:EscU/YscU/HrcU family type III secretion system export apparatus switch protein n=1 Tax=Cognatishimia sp. MH4019 TaxID=2854030 RepID=UPI001CD38E3D|nr:flagellar type III secretion system protein FlhB [Cognatishimia sp. MH4019]
MSEDESGEKQHEPTQKKLDDARKKGEVPRSTDLNTAAAYGGFLIVAIALGAALLADTGTALMILIDRSNELSQLIFESPAAPVVGGAMLSIGGSLLPWFGLPAVAVLVTIIAQRSFVVTPDKLIPKASRISILSNAKNKFGRSGLFEFAKSTAKLIIYSVLLGVFLMVNLNDIVSTIYLSPAMALSLLASLTVKFLAVVLMISLAIGGIDFFWQRYDHMMKNRMSHEDLKNEVKSSEGDPQMKQQRRQRGYEIAMNQMLADVPKADVVIVNPTHYAVALSWSRQAGAAPVVVAKGVDEIAARIRETATEANVAIHSDPPTARAIFATIEIGQEVMPEHYKPVAAAIRFADALRGKAKKTQ